MYNAPAVTGHDPEEHHRRSIRLPGYDYAQAGSYFVTIVTQGRECLFGMVIGGEMQLNDAGRMVEDAWAQIGGRFVNVEPDEHIVMPNHFHGILIIADVGASPVGARLVGGSPVGAPLVGAPGSSTRDDPTADRTGNPPLGDIIGAFKSITTVQYIHGVRNLGWPVFNKRLWQRNYYEHIIRDDRGLDNVRQYLFDNPTRWSEDAENTDRNTSPETQ
ncbi:MAG: transposase [Anaerolineales bacterium]|nr:MAG: transposase [Anaerolineales bacterium]